MITLQLGTQTITLDARNPRVMIGRDAATCNLLAADQSVSRRHAEVALDAGGQAWLRDYGSSNGTWVDGRALPPGTPALLSAQQQVFVGHMPLMVSWERGGATVFGSVSPQMIAMMDAHKAQQQVAAQASASSMSGHAPGTMGAVGETIGVGGKQAPKAAELPYRRQGSNENGALLIALARDTFANGDTLDGFVEFTALDDESVASIVVELVEFHRKGSSKGHVWDRMLVRQGPWKARKNEVLPLPFELRVPPGTSMSGREVFWEVRGYVDIDWAFDIEASSPINMRNIDIERLRDALGGLDFRIGELEPAPLGQRFTGSFQPPAQLREQWGISDVNLLVEYLGTNLQLKLEVEKTALTKWDRDITITFDLEQLRNAPVTQISEYMRQQIEGMMRR
ncbi:MAG: FHA domain-containing protein [Deltaproteobacteria bacterium]|nr:FHA domain-containing protein [Nannocystaceae bacterium]